MHTEGWHRLAAADRECGVLRSTPECQQQTPTAGGLVAMDLGLPRGLYLPCNGVWDTCVGLHKVAPVNCSQSCLCPAGQRHASCQQLIHELTL